jgi:hypothetical protein
VALFNSLTLYTIREEMPLTLLQSIVSFQFEALARWAKDIKLTTVIQHVGGGAKTCHTAFKQKMLPNYKLENKANQR